MKRLLLLFTFLSIITLDVAASATRVKDVARVQGVRTNQLIGYGLVVGLDRTGDSQRTSFTIQSLAAMMSRMGIRIDQNDLTLRNIAAVMVTAKLPAFAQPGGRIDVVVSSIGDARSLVGGTLLLTPLKGVDGQVYGMAQGPLQVGGYGASGRSGSMRIKNHLNVGSIPAGASIERAVPITLGQDGRLVLQIDKPDFSTAKLISDALNAAVVQLGGGAGTQLARPLHSGAVEVTVPAGRAEAIPSFVADLEILAVQPDAIAKVVINGRTGTVVMGDRVRISTVAIAHGGLTVEVKETPSVSQPNAFADGQTATTTQSEVSVSEVSGTMKMVTAGATLAEIVEALNALGAKPRDLVDILLAMKAAGALQAELEII